MATGFLFFFLRLNDPVTLMLCEVRNSAVAEAGADLGLQIVHRGNAGVTEASTIGIRMLHESPCAHAIYYGCLDE
jgi:hypothetical protein